MGIEWGIRQIFSDMETQINKTIVMHKTLETVGNNSFNSSFVLTDTTLNRELDACLNHSRLLKS